MGGRINENVLELAGIPHCSCEVGAVLHAAAWQVFDEVVIFELFT